MKHLTLMVCAFPLMASAQVATGAPGTDRWERTQAIPKGHSVRVETKSGGEQSGPLEGVTAAGLRLLVKGKPTAIARAEVVNVWRLVPPRHRKWATIGAVSAGLLVGFAANINEALRDDCGSADSNCGPAAWGAAGLLVAAPIGGGVAAWMLSGKPKPVLVYSAPRPDNP